VAVDGCNGDLAAAKNAKSNYTTWVPVCCGVLFFRPPPKKRGGQETYHVRLLFPMLDSTESPILPRYQPVHQDSTSIHKGQNGFQISLTPEQYAGAVCSAVMTTARTRSSLSNRSKARTSSATRLLLKLFLLKTVEVEKLIECFLERTALRG
jgi:hypothetical protein